MGVTKQYLRYKPCGKFNVIGSTWAKLVVIETPTTSGPICAVGACEDVLLWNMRNCEKAACLTGDQHSVTALARSHDSRFLAVGYRNGVIRVFDVASGECTVTFSGHRTQVSALNYDALSMRLVSGGLDTDVVVWDVVAEAGQYRLRGHKGQVTQARFLHHRNVLVTSSKDATVKFWDLDSQHCFKTLVGHTREVWDFVVARDENLLITSSADLELRIWRISFDENTSTAEKQAPMDVDDSVATETETESEDSKGILDCQYAGSVMRNPSRDHVTSLVLSSDGHVLGCHGNNGRIIELFKILTAAELQKHLQKRLKKTKKKAAKESGGETSDVQVAVTQTIEDEVRRLGDVRLSSKLHSFQCIVGADGRAKIVALLKNNSIEMCVVDTTERKLEPTGFSRLTLPGHRTEPRTLAFSSDGTAILSASGDSARVWNRSTLQCIRAMDCDYAVCSLFAPGDRHVILGTKSGKLQIFDLASGSLLEDVDAHTDSVTSICMAPDKRSIVTGSSDKDVKFWDFELVSDENYSATAKRLSVVHTRTLKMAEGILCVKYSSDQKLLAVSLLDNTVKVFFADTCKFFLNLYGHSLPVTCLDISTDVTVIATGSNDKSVRIWGLDFGNCLKFIRAHDAPVQCLQFIAKTHMFFTCSNDGSVKQFDADSFELITTLQGHQDFVSCLCVSPNGSYAVSGSHDRSIRLWEKTDEILVLSEEREMERERANDEAAVQNSDVVIAGEINSEVAVAGRQTVETMKAAERLMEALDLHDTETEKLTEHREKCKQHGKMLPEPPLNPVFQAFGVKTPSKYVFEVIKRIKSSELEEALLVLPFSYVIRLLELMRTFVESSAEIELAQRCLGFLLRIHHGQITANQVLLPVLDDLRRIAESRATHLMDISGFVLAALRFNKLRLETRQSVGFFTDATQRARDKKRKKAAILTIHT